jgi:EmrB/QacA subfamily drug resistance transporter
MNKPDNYKWLVLIAVGASTFMSALDTSVVNTVLPVINQALNSQIAKTEWIITIYLLGVSGLLLTFGRLGDIRGHKSIFLSGFGIFILSSAVCGISSSVYMLIAARGTQAIGAAMLAANSPAILTTNFPANQRGQALGLQATMTYLGLTLAPSVGGWLASLFSWRAVFFINIPVGLTAFLLSWFFIPSDAPEHKGEPFDFLGAGLFMAGLVLLLLGLNQGHAWGWGSPVIISILIGAGIFTLLFIWVENHAHHPMLDLSLFKSRLFCASTGGATLNYIALYSVLLLLPFYLIQGRGMTTAHAGLILTAQPLVMAVVAPISGTLSDRIGARKLCMAGMATMSTGLIVLSRLNSDSSVLLVLIGLAIVGLGTGTFISPNNSALMGSAPYERQGIAAGIMATARSTGMVLGVGLSGAILTTAMAGIQGNQALYSAIHISFLVSAAIAGIGVFTGSLQD